MKKIKIFFTIILALAIAGLALWFLFEIGPKKVDLPLPSSIISNLKSSPSVSLESAGNSKTFSHINPQISFNYTPSYREYANCLKPDVLGGGKTLFVLAGTKAITGCKNTDGETVISLSYYSPASVCLAVNDRRQKFDSCAKISEEIVTAALAKLSKNSSNFRVSKIDRANINGYEVSSDYMNDGTGVGALASGVGPAGKYAEKDIVFQNKDGLYFVLDILRMNQIRESDTIVLNEIINSLNY